MTNRDKLVVGIVGAGKTGSSAHVANWKKRKVEICLCDADGEKAARVAAALAIDRHYTDLTEMLEKEKPDIIDIATPPQTHSRLAIQSLRHGSHVLVEKPMATSVAECDAMIRAASENRLQLGVVHNRLFFSRVMQAKSLVRSGSLGKVMGVDIKLVHHAPELVEDERHWSHSLSCGVLGESLPHAVYLLREFIGDLEPVAACMARSNDQLRIKADELRVIVKGEKGTGTIFHAFSPIRGIETIDISGTKGNLHIILDTTLIKYGTGSESRVSQAMDNIGLTFQTVGCVASNARTMVSGGYTAGYPALLDSFVESIRHGTKPAVTGEDGREIMRVIEEIAALMEGGDRSNNVVRSSR